jgi:hypothetical protein
MIMPRPITISIMPMTIFFIELLFFVVVAIVEGVVVPLLLEVDGLLLVVGLLLLDEVDPELLLLDEDELLVDVFAFDEGVLVPDAVVPEPLYVLLL